MVLKQVLLSAGMKSGLDKYAKDVGVKSSVAMRWAIDEFLVKNLPGYQPEFTINQSEQFAAVAESSVS